MSLPSDIIAKIQHDFDKGEVVPVIELISEFSAEDRETFNDRVLRCVIYLSKGSFSELARNLAHARTDWRDVIYWAEYDANDARIRDHSVPFPL